MNAFLKFDFNFEKYAYDSRYFSVNERVGLCIQGAETNDENGLPIALKQCRINILF